MSKGRTSLLVTLLVALVCVGFLMPTMATAENKGMSPSGGNVHFYPAYGLTGGPYVIACTYFPGPSPADPGNPPRIVVVFNEDVAIDPAVDSPSDHFESNDDAAAGLGRLLTNFNTLTYLDDGSATNNVVWIGFDNNTPANNGFVNTNLDYIISALPGAILAVDGSVNFDVSPITISRGPVVVNVSVTGRENDFGTATGPNDNSVVIEFNAPVDFVTNVGNAFGATPEFNAQPLASAGGGTSTLTITRAGSATGNFLYMNPGVMNLNIANGTVRYTATGQSVANNVPYVVATENDGPLLLGAYYDPGNPNDVRIIFDQVVNSISDTFDSQFDEGGTWNPVDGNVANATLLDWTNILRHTGWVNPPGDDAGTIDLDAANTLTDYQGMPALDGPAVPVHLGPGILRAWYYDNNTPANTADDQLWLQLSDRLANGNDVTLAHFETEGFEFGPNTITSYIEPSDPTDQTSKFLFQNFNGSTDAFESGDRIIPANTGPALVTAAGNPLYFAEVQWTPVHDESRPSQLVIRDDNSEQFDEWIPDIPNELVTMYLRFTEDEIPGSAAGFEDSDQYFLFIIGPDETFDEAVDQANRLEQAIPLGNLNSRRVSVTIPPERYNTTRLGLSISYGDEQPGDPPGWIYRTTSGLDITDPSGIRPYDQLRFFVAAADWQGNVTHITDQYAWDELFARPSELDIRAYIQDPDCTPVQPGVITLYALHYDLDPASVRFEFQLADSPTDYCGEEDPATLFETAGNVTGDARGDRVVYIKKNGQGTSDLIRSDMEWFPFTYTPGDPFVYYYWDTDNDGRYTTQDPVIRSFDWEADIDELYNGTDELIIGTDEYTETIPLDTPLTRFTTYDSDNLVDSPRDPIAYYWAQANGEEPNELDDSDVIFRENTVNYEPTENGDAIVGLNLWTIPWAACAELPDDETSGNFLVRAIARDLFGNEDQIDQDCVNEDPNQGTPDYAPEEVIWLTLNNCADADWETTVDAIDAFIPLYDDPGEQGGEKWEYSSVDVDLTNPEIPPHTNYIKVTASTNVTTPDGLAFRFTDNGGVDWYYLVPNANVAIADLDGVPGYQTGDPNVPAYLRDQLVQDDGDFVFETGVDTVTEDNGNPNVVPNNQILLPYVGDPSQWIPYLPGDPIPPEAIDTTAPYEALLNLVGRTGTVDFTFVAEAVRNLEDACPSGEMLVAGTQDANIQNWLNLPVPDIPVPVVTFIGPNPAFVDTVDVGHPLNDGTPYEVLEPIAERRLHIYARADYGDIASVRLWYRTNPACGDPTVWMQPAEAHMDLSVGDPWDEYPDINYPFEFRWKAGVLAEGNYQFYIEWTDSDGNVNPPLFLPYGFAINQYGGESLANVTREAPADRCEAGPSFDVGAIKCFSASLADPTLEGQVAVRFYFAPRIQGRMYTGADLVGGTLTLEETLLDPSNGGLVICNAEGDEILASDYTALAGSNEITWTDNIPEDDEVFYVSYNFRVSPNESEWWLPIGLPDTEAPYQACWSEESTPAGVPNPQDPDANGVVEPNLDWSAANAYDIIAVATIDIDGDGFYGDSEGGLLSLCDITEPMISENANHILVRTVTLPIVHLYGLDYESNDPWGYPQQKDAPANYWPGNPFGVSESEDPEGALSWEGKLSGNEANVFVTATTDQSASITGVNLSLFRQYEADPYKTIAMTKVVAGDDLDMIVTMYPEDYYEVRPAELERATITLMVQEGGAGPIDAYPMTVNADGDYTALATFGTQGETYKYWFDVDTPTRDFELVDRRNNSGGPVPESWIRMPDEEEFWYTPLAVADFDPNPDTRIYRAKVEATDTLGRIGTNLFDGSDVPQGPITFVYDRVAPIPVRMWAEPPYFGAGTDGRIYLEVTDPLPPEVDDDIITTRTVIFQYNPTPGTEKNWLELGRDLDEADGWWVPYNIGIIPDPLADTFDNDNDGIIDEEDEDEVVFEIRAVIFDDAGFGGDPLYAQFPGSGNPTYYDANGMTIAYDGQAPFTVITTPHDGDVFAIDGPAITIVGSPTDTRPEVLPPGRVLADDIDRVKFQYSVDNGATDFIDIDPTPADGDGDPWIEPTSPNQTEFSIVVDPELFEVASDTYVWVRMIAEDISGNQTSEALLPEDAEIIHIIVNDTVAPMAYFQVFQSDCGCGITDDLIEYANNTVTIGGVVVDPTQPDLTGVVGVDIEIMKPGDTAFTVIGTVLRADFVDHLNNDGCPEAPLDDDGVLDYFSWAWDTLTGPGGIYPEGSYLFQLTTLDTDGNRYTSPIQLTVVIDRTGTDVVYSPEGGKPYTTVAPYSDNNIADPLTSLVVVPDPFTGDLEFYVYTAETVDVGELGVILLQYRDPSFPGNDWTNTNIEFMYTPGLNIAGHKAWVAHVEDYVDTFDGVLAEQPWEWRAFVQDLACNTNINLGAAITATVDFTPPTVWELVWDKPTNEVVTGEDITFTLRLKDNVTDVDRVRILAIEPDDTEHLVGYGELTDADAIDLDGPNTLWKFQAVWSFDEIVYRNTPLTIKVEAYDTAGNLLEYEDPTQITVLDNTAPDMTKIFGVQGLVYYVDDEDDDIDDLPGGVYDPTCLDCNDDVFIDNNNDGLFQAAVDILVSGGEDLAIPENAVGTAYGALLNTYPRDAREGFLNVDTNVLKVNNLITIIARTQGGDQNFGNDDGIAYVEFWATNKATGENILLGKDEHVPGFPSYLWHIGVDVTATNFDGTPLFDEGVEYNFWAKAVDLAGNEEIAPFEPTPAEIVPDMTAPIATMDADVNAPGIQQTAQAQRNEVFTLFAVTDDQLEDDDVTFYMKRERDLNTQDVWDAGFVQNGWVVDGSSDENPATQRPYSFNLDLNKAEDPLTNNNPIPVGEKYEFVGAAMDEVGNLTTAVDTRADATQRHITVEIIDTIAPPMTITSLVVYLDRITNNFYIVNNPDRVHAKDVGAITATNLQGHTDLKEVMFLYRPQSGGDWTLIETVAVGNPLVGISIADWDLTALRPDEWYELVAVGVDDVGNTGDANTAAKVLIYVDHTAPAGFAFLAPTNADPYFCEWYEGVDEEIWFDLKVADGDATEDDDIYDVNFFIKRNAEVDVEGNWDQIDNPGDTEDVTHDLDTHAWMFRFDLDDWEIGTNLYDLKAVITDMAGNKSEVRLDRIAYDITDPTMTQITNIVDNTGVPIVFHPDGETDIAEGVELRITGHALDDELDLPVDRETALASLQFEVSVDFGVTWQAIGLPIVNPDPTALDFVGTVDWNTTGLPVDDDVHDPPTRIRVRAMDSCGNETISAAYIIRIIDGEPPTARIVAFDVDQVPHGDTPVNMLHIYALAESDPQGYSDVMFQYDTVDGDESHEWVNIGVGASAPCEPTDATYSTEDLWVVDLDLSEFAGEVTQLWLRAIAKDDRGNYYDVETDVPVMLVDLVDYFEGGRTVKPAAVLDTDKVLESVSVQMDSPEQAILEVVTTDASVRPRVVVLGESAIPGEMIDNCWIYTAGIPSDPENGSFGLVRAIDNDRVWRGKIALNLTWDLVEITDCEHFYINVIGLTASKRIDHNFSRPENTTVIHEYPVTEELGTNGTVGHPMGDPNITVTIPSGGWDYDAGCLLISRTLAPSLDPEDMLYLEEFDGEDAYYLDLTKVDGAGALASFETGYLPTVTIYNDAFVDKTVTVRRWNPTDGAWDSFGIINVQHDPADDFVTFNVNNLTNPALGKVFQVFMSPDTAPIAVERYVPESEYVNNVTDADPMIRFYLRGNGQPIDPSTVQLSLNKVGEAPRIVASWLTWGDADFYQGSSEAELWPLDPDGTVAELVYRHSTYKRDWLEQGDHEVTLRFRALDDLNDFNTYTETFSVDLTPPELTFLSGFITSPELHNVTGYIANPTTNNTLVVTARDRESGILVRPLRQEFVIDADGDNVIDPNEMNPNIFYDHGQINDPDESLLPIDWSMKYDVWVVNREDDQLDIDELEQRTLIHTGNGAELVTQTDPNLREYNPLQQDLTIKLPTVGGGHLIKDGDIIEVVLYSQKTTSHQGPELECAVDTLMIGGQMFTLVNCWVEAQSQMVHNYQFGVLDQARNAASQYLEARFVVDMAPPVCEILLPGALQQPNEDMVIQVHVGDDGAGIKSTGGTIVGPDGPIEVEWTYDPDTDMLTATVDASLVKAGEYTITVKSEDLLGNSCVVTKTVRVEATQLALSGAYASPNPFDPAQGDADITFGLSRTSDVTIKVYDFAGNFVTTLKNNESMAGGNIHVPWGGTAADGTKLANGAYIVRVTANDGGRTEVTNLKVVIWRD